MELPFIGLAPSSTKDATPPKFRADQRDDRDFSKAFERSDRDSTSPASRSRDDGQARSDATRSAASRSTSADKPQAADNGRDQDAEKGASGAVQSDDGQADAKETRGMDDHHSDGSNAESARDDAKAVDQVAVQRLPDLVELPAALTIGQMTGVPSTTANETALNVEANSNTGEHVVPLSPSVQQTDAIVDGAGDPSVPAATDRITEEPDLSLVSPSKTESRLAADRARGGQAVGGAAGSLNADAALEAATASEGKTGANGESDGEGKRPTAERSNAARGAQQAENISSALAASGARVGANLPENVQEPETSENFDISPTPTDGVEPPQATTTASSSLTALSAAQNANVQSTPTIDALSQVPDTAVIAPEGLTVTDSGRIERATTLQADSAMFARPETGRHVSAQIADVIRASSDGALEISPRPAELGRLTLGFSSDASGLHVTLSAERPETLDLIRRSIGVLENDLRDLGYSNMNFSFGQDNSRQARRDGQAPADGGYRPETIDSLGPVGAVELAKTRRAATGALDLRL